MSAWQETAQEWFQEVADRVGVRYRPEQMGLPWDDVAAARRILPEHVLRAGLWHTVASQRPINEEFIARTREWLQA